MNKILLLILCAIVFAQAAKPKAAVYIKGNPEGRDALRMAVNTFLIKSGKYQMIAVDAIDIVAKEQNRQMSGSVSNEDIAMLGRDAGAQYVCVVERSELDGTSYVSTSMVSVQSKIAELSEMSELPRGGRIINIIERQINSMLGIAMPPEPVYEYVSEPTYEPTYEPEPEPSKLTPTRYYEQPEEPEEESPAKYKKPHKPGLQSIYISSYRTSVKSFYDYKGQELLRNGLNIMVGTEGINGSTLFGFGMFIGLGRLGSDIFEFNVGVEVKKLFWLWEDVIAIPASVGIAYRRQGIDIENRIVATFIDEPEFLKEPEDYLDDKRNMFRSNMDILPSLDLEIFFGSSFSIYAGYMYRITPLSGDWNISYKKTGETTSDDYKVPEMFDPLKKSKEQVFGRPGTLRFGMKFY